MCLNRGFGDSPSTWVGIGTFNVKGDLSFQADGERTCHPYGADTPAVVAGNPIFDFLYDSDADGLIFAPDGVTYQRADPGLRTDSANPFVGSWEGTDSDGTHVMIDIFGDGRFESSDTRSGGCERKGFIRATWSSTGVGEFSLDGLRTYEMSGGTFCHPSPGEQVVHSPSVTFSYVYNAVTDSLVYVRDGTTYSRVP